MEVVDLTDETSKMHNHLLGYAMLKRSIFARVLSLL